MFSIRSDAFLEVARALAVVAASVTCLLVASILVMRWRRGCAEVTAQEFEVSWRPVLMAAVIDPTRGDLPFLSARDQFAFLKLWNYLHESLHGAASDNLNVLARRLQCNVAALGMLHGRDRGARLLAILTLGHLRETRAWHALRGAADSSDTVESLLAARALILVDGQAGVEALLPLILARRDWDMARLARMLEPARDAASVHIGEALPQLAEAARLRALMVIEALRVDLPGHHLDSALRRGEPPKVIAVALRLARHPRQVPAIRGLLAHPDWRVRFEAVDAMARLGDAADIRTLTHLIQDPQWWVRYRAADALAASPLLGAGELQALRAGTTTPEATEILAHVFAERGLA